MKKRDLMEMQAVCSVCTLVYSLDEFFDQVIDDLPKECEATTFRASLKNFMHRLENYNESKRETFLNACEDYSGDD